MKKLKIGADAWIEKNPYNNKKGYGRKKHKEWNKNQESRLAKHKTQRAENGYSWYDFINFDSFIASVVATAVLKFAEDGMGYFPIGGEQINGDTWDYPEGTAENFNATCGSIYYALTQWLTVDEFSPGHEARYEEAKEAMILFSEHLGSWWD